ncbi:MAG: 3-ketoacyl-ACP reductase [Candidatus Hydrogenedentes bacterium]|nr:3-ketoacyl-ACP reductase [Candidatus Hydrogenedentota bacterium]
MQETVKGTALVTCASRGIGRGIAIELARHGFDIAGAATQIDPGNAEKGLYEVKARVEEMGRRFVPVVGNIADVECHEAILDTVLSAYGRVDVLVNNAGVAPEQRLDLLETTAASYDRVMGINLRGPFFFTQRVARQMVQQPVEKAHTRPCIIFITSISANTASPNRAEYCVSKAGLSMTAQNFAVRLAEHGINVYEVRPGIIATDMTAAVQEKYDRLIAGGLLLQKRWGTPEDIGKACAALATGYLDYATGACLEVGGGVGVQRL